MILERNKGLRASTRALAVTLLLTNFWSAVVWAEQGTHEAVETEWTPNDEAIATAKLAIGEMSNEALISLAGNLALKGSKLSAEEFKAMLSQGAPLAATPQKSAEIQQALEKLFSLDSESSPALQLNMLAIAELSTRSTDGRIASGKKLSEDQRLQELKEELADLKELREKREKRKEKEELEKISKDLARALAEKDSGGKSSGAGENAPSAPPAGSESSGSPSGSGKKGPSTEDLASELADRLLGPKGTGLSTSSGSGDVASESAPEDQSSGGDNMDSSGSSNSSDSVDDGSDSEVADAMNALNLPEKPSITPPRDYGPKTELSAIPSGQNSEAFNPPSGGVPRTSPGASSVGPMTASVGGSSSGFSDEVFRLGLVPQPSQTPKSYNYDRTTPYLAGSGESSTSITEFSGVTKTAKGRGMAASVYSSSASTASSSSSPEMVFTVGSDMFGTMCLEGKLNCKSTEPTAGESTQ